MTDYRIIAAAESMRMKRAELQHLPLDRIWRDLAECSVAAFRAAEKKAAKDNLNRLSQGGAN